MYRSHHPMINVVFSTLSNLVRLVTTASMLLVIIIFAGVPFRVFLMQQELIVGVWLATLTIGFFLFVYFLFHKSKGLFYSFIFIILVLGSAFFIPQISNSYSFISCFEIGGQWHDNICLV